MADKASLGTPSSDPQPFDFPFGTPINLEKARALVAVGEAEAKARGWKMAIAIVEPTGALVCFAKMDNTQYGAIDFALGKAQCAARMRRSTKILQEAVNGDNAAMATLPGVVAIEGGIPLIVDGLLIGAVGVSGAAGRQDGIIAQTIVDALS